jgi:hypothetical protein
VISGAIQTVARRFRLRTNVGERFCFLKLSVSGFALTGRSFSSKGNEGVLGVAVDLQITFILHAPKSYLLFNDIVSHDFSVRRHGAQRELTSYISRLYQCMFINLIHIQEELLKGRLNIAGQSWLGA